MTDGVESYIPFGYQPAFSKLQQLGPYQVRRLLLVSSQYDFFILEEDGRLQDILGRIYKKRDLGYVPAIKQVDGAEAAFQELSTGAYDLVLMGQRLGEMEPIEFCQRIRNNWPELPLALLAYNTPELERLTAGGLSVLWDRVFVWQGDGRILAAIIQHIEDARNALPDSKILDLPHILVVEDNPRFYSSYLIGLYDILEASTNELLSEDLTYTQRLLRQRARPKVLLAQNYEQAASLVAALGHNLLGLITDVRFPQNGSVDPEAGLMLARAVREKMPGIPVLIQSSEPQAREQALAQGLDYLDKNLPTLASGLRSFLNRRLGFGPLEFSDPEGQTFRLASLSDLNFTLERLPAHLFWQHLKDGSLIRWLLVRSELDLASVCRRAASSDTSRSEEIRLRLLATMGDLRRLSHRGSLVPFVRSFFQDPAIFSRIGGGSIGGKARGLAFIDRVLHEKLDPGRFPGIEISIPKTVVLGTEVFDEFLKENQLLDFALGEMSDIRIINRFLHAALSARVVGDLRDLMAELRAPLAVRSSSLLEDALYQPFAGIYATKMIPNNLTDTDSRFLSLVNAIKFVYASTYFQRAKAYIRATGHRPEEERMAVVIQEVVGRRHGERFYPDLSGVARSYNYYPVGHARPQDGVVNLALGLGKTIVDGGTSLIFTPAYPNVLPQLYDRKSIFENSQRHFYAIDLSQSSSTSFTEEDQYLKQYDLRAAEDDGVLNFLASTYDFESDCLRDGLNSPGPRVISFAHILKNEVLPLAKILEFLLPMSAGAMACPVEMEFACILDPQNALPARFGFLQVRPMVSPDSLVKVEISAHDLRQTVVSTRQALGNGIQQVRDIVYVRPEAFDAAKTREIAAEVAQANAIMEAQGRRFLLIGPGRWGSSDPWLGVPVDWSQITQVQAIVEVALPNMNVDPSQGSHFFQNMTSLGIGYFTIPLDPNVGTVDWDWLNSQPGSWESPHLRLLSFAEPLEIRIDGRTGQGVILKRAVGN